LTRLRGLSAGTLYTIALATGLVVALVWALYLSYWGGVDVSNAFDYQSAVVAAQRDAELLEVEQNDRRGVRTQLRPYEKLLDSDLSRIEATAASPAQRAPLIRFPATVAGYQRLDAQLRALEELGRRRFADAASLNERTRNASNVMFALVALLFTIVQERLRRRIEVNRSLVERLQRAFISRHGDLPNVAVGSVLISATQGSQIGGDLFDVFSYDGRLGAFLVADVSGKGIDAAVDTAFIKYAIRALFSERSDPGDVLTRFAAIYSHNAESDDTFVVLFLGVIDTETGVVRYASAGHEPAWVRTGGQVRILPPTGPLIGVIPDTQYESHRFELGAGDEILISTDGLTESRDARGKLLEAEGVHAWFSEARSGAQETADGIVQRLRKRSRRIDDDLAILVLRYEP
jgi:serine phosphatase RsbU (regulator of sigma subunit)